MKTITFTLLCLILTIVRVHKQSKDVNGNTHIQGGTVDIGTIESSY